MIEIGISALVLTVGLFFLLGMGIGIFAMVKAVKNELEHWEN
jgi:uncharacterized protein YneF (UPF0154 family)